MLTPKQQQTYQFIQRYLVQKGLAPTTTEIAAALGIKSKGVVHRYLHALAELNFIELLPGRRRNIRLTSQNEVDSSQAFGCLPILGRIAAGRPIEAISEQAYLNVTETLLGAKRYLLEVRGDSMIGDNICDGDLVICEQRQTACNGEIVIALIQHREVTLKRIYYQPNGTVRLMPSNPALKPMIFRAEEVTVQGVYLGLLRVKQR
jgi:repressor LexA